MTNEQLRTMVFEALDDGAVNDLNLIEADPSEIAAELKDYADGFAAIDTNKLIPLIEEWQESWED